MSRRLLLLTIGAAAVFLLPWTAYLGRTLPAGHSTGLWRTAWVGFDLGLIACFAAATVLGARRRRAAVPILCATAALLCADAWFDIVLDWSDPDRWLSITLAVVAELPFAALLLRYAGKLLSGGMRSRTATLEDLALAQDDLAGRCHRALAELAPANTSLIAGAVGDHPAQVTAALRRLAWRGHAHQGLDQRWRLSGPVDLRLPDPAAADPADRRQVTDFVAAKFSQELDLLRWAADHRDDFGPWGKGERAAVLLTEDELHRFNQEYRELLARYCQLHRAGPGETSATRRIAVRFYAFPDRPPTADARSAAAK